MSLTDVQIRNAKPNEKDYKLADERGLYLLITPSGGKLWRMNYRFLGKQKTLSMGSYPEVSLIKARGKRDEARAQLAEGIDPAEIKRKEMQRRRILASNTFESVARDWFVRHLSRQAKSTQAKVTSRMERFAFPYIGSRPISEITTPDILAVARRVESVSSLDTAHRVKQEIAHIIRYAIQIGLAEKDPTIAMRGALPPVKQKHFAAPDTAFDKGFAQICEIIRMMDGHKGTLVVSAAIKLLPLVFCRPGELRKMRWEHINLEKGNWYYWVSKTDTDHLVPLSTQAVSILRDIYPVTGHLAGGWVFPGNRSKLVPMSDAAINSAYKRMGIDTQKDITGHGWRSVARTMLCERLKYQPDFIERQLSHTVHNANGRAYDRTQYIDERRPMMQVWADYIDVLREVKNVEELDAIYQEKAKQLMLTQQQPDSSRLNNEF